VTGGSGTRDVAVIGGGIVGVATALALRRMTRATVTVLEAESRLATHQTGRNSGVIHAGLYYKPGSLKARNCTAGREALYRYCAEHGVLAERCGKLVVATTSEELPALDELERRGRANGLRGLRRLSAGELGEVEPQVRGLAGLLVPETGIVDYAQVTAALAGDLRRLDGEVRTDARFLSLARSGSDTVLSTASGEVRCRFVIACAGLQADRVARRCGVDPGVRIVPFRGEYWELAPERRGLVRNLIYPVPDPRFPFLGVHFTRKISGAVEAGPNAVLALRREGYRRTSFSLRDTAAVLSAPAFWRLAARYWRTGMAEMWRSASRRAFARALQRLVPEVTAADLRPGGAGVRAQALDDAGNLLDDFHIVEADRQLHVLNAPSPAATASLAIGEHLARLAAERWSLPARSATG
jgi:L-2-hydroxyglutarate oxidase